MAIVAGTLMAVGLYVFLVEPLWVLPVLEWLTPGILYRVKTRAREALVALSFDDGPHAVFTPEVLEILERYGAKATFFLIGERAERNPELVEWIRAAGHEIGNHCWRDGSVLGHSRERFAEELERTERAVGIFTSKSGPFQSLGCARDEKAGPTTGEKQAPRRREASVTDGLRQDSTTGGDTKAGAARSGYATEGPTQKLAPTTARSSLRFFRAPGGVAWPWQLRLARERGYTCVLGCAYPHDPMRPPVRYMKWLIEKNLRPGTIVILHDGIRDARKSIEVLPQILEAGKRKRLKFVSIGELMSGG